MTNVIDRPNKDVLELFEVLGLETADKRATYASEHFDPLVAESSPARILLTEPIHHTVVPDADEKGEGDAELE